MAEPRHERLSIALCEAVEFGDPVLIRLSPEAMSELLAGMDRYSAQKIELPADRFEGVPVVVERGFTGCVVEHDSRYTAPIADGSTAVPDTAVLMRDTRKPAIVAW